MLSSYFFPFSFQNGSKTLKRNNQILFFIPNSSYFDEDSIQIEEYKNYNIIGNLGVFIYIEFNEILGDYLRTILSKITTINYISQSSRISEKSELGECIEFLLFKQRISNFSLIQLIYILGVNNYNIDFRTFRNNFQNISNHIPSDICKDMFLQINIKLTLSNIKKE